MRMKTKQHFEKLELDPHKFEDTNGITIPITYPDRRSKSTSCHSVWKKTSYCAKEWVDYNIK